MGLVQRELEAACFTTITLSNIPDLTASASTPRVVGVEHPFGQTMGKPGDSETQLAVLRGVLAALEDIDTPGDVRCLPFTWHQTLKEIQAQHKESPPISSYLVKRPWLVRKLIVRDIPDQP
ncbi:MAG TPA: hypothetical protein VLA32_10460 [Anaerolineales bacterium]|nr:hypothetical protein [Anaerolineales bacterium]